MSRLDDNKRSPRPMHEQAKAFLDRLGEEVELPHELRMHHEALLRDLLEKMHDDGIRAQQEVQVSMGMSPLENVAKFSRRLPARHGVDASDYRLSEHEKMSIGKILSGYGTWFGADLLRLVGRADGANINKLRREYPHHVDAVLQYRKGSHVRPESGEDSPRLTYKTRPRGTAGS